MIASKFSFDPDSDVRFMTFDDFPTNAEQFARKGVGLAYINIGGKTVAVIVTHVAADDDEE